jgi:hypothetical protein
MSLLLATDIAAELFDCRTEVFNATDRHWTRLNQSHLLSILKTFNPQDPYISPGPAIRYSKIITFFIINYCHCHFGPNIFVHILVSYT